MKKLIMSLALLFLASGIAVAQTKKEATKTEATKVVAVFGHITLLSPDKIMIPSTGEYLYLARVTTTGAPALYVSKNPDLYARFSAKGKDSVIILDGAVFKPLQRYTKRQWRKLSRQIKIYFPESSQKQLEEMNMYLIFNQEVFHINDESLNEFFPTPVVETEVNTNTSTGKTKSKVEIDPLTGRPKR
ncbi:MAG: hypothetical protein QG594_2534 [Bacteroidota bacterium]|nr:hypothetical protein [Bacteroidota bacterium]